MRDNWGVLHLNYLSFPIALHILQTKSRALTSTFWLHAGPCKRSFGHVALAPCPQLRPRMGGSDDVFHVPHETFIFKVCNLHRIQATEVGFSLQMVCVVKLGSQLVEQAPFSQGQRGQMLISQQKCAQQPAGLQFLFAPKMWSIASAAHRQRSIQGVQHGCPDSGPVNSSITAVLWQHLLLAES